MRTNLDSRKKSVKIILLGSGYNALQEGDERYDVQVMPRNLQVLCQPGFAPNSTSIKNIVRTNQIYFDFNPATDSFRYIFRDDGGYISQGFIPAAQVSAFNNDAVSLEDAAVKAQIFNIIDQRNVLPKNPFITAALRAGYEIDVDSVDQREPRLREEKKAWGKVNRIQMDLSLRDITPERRKILDELRTQWHADVEKYDAVIFVNTDGDGFLDRLFFSFYEDYQNREDVFFADWCTCCVAPCSTRRAFGDGPGLYRFGANVGSPGGRAMRSDSSALPEDLRLFFNSIDHHLERQAVRQQPRPEREEPPVSLTPPVSPRLIIPRDRHDRLFSPTLKQSSDLGMRALEKCDFMTHFNIIESKSLELSKKAMSNRQYREAARVAEVLLHQLKSAKNTLLISKEVDVFKATCLSAIDEAMPVLKKHRGWKQVLADLVSALVSLLTLGLANLATGRYKLFPVKTDSEKKIELMASALQSSLTL